VAAYASLKSRNFRFLLASSVLSVLAQQMLSIVVGWDLYESTHSAVVLGNVGLVQIIPPILFTFAAGYAADHYDRRRTAALAQVVIAAVGFLLASAGAARGVALIYTCLLLSATARAFQWPASSALLPQLVEPEVAVEKGFSGGELKLGFAAKRRVPRSLLSGSGNCVACVGVEKSDEAFQVLGRGGKEELLAHEPHAAQA
jgi:MFS family permease